MTNFKPSKPVDNNVLIAKHLADARYFGSLLALKTCTESDLEFLYEKLSIALDNIQKLTKPADANIKRNKAIAIVLSLNVFNFRQINAWEDANLYGLMGSKNYVWSPSRLEWLNLAEIAGDNEMFLAALETIYDLDGDIDVRYCIPTMASLYVQSEGFTWNSKFNAWYRELPEYKQGV